MTRERRLGRGLEALLGKMAASSQPADTDPTQNPTGPVADSSYGGTTKEPYTAAAQPFGHGVEDPVVESGQPPVLAPVGADDPGRAAPRDVSAETASSDAGGDLDPIRVGIRQIDSNPLQPRRDFDEAELQSLGESLRAHGLLQPVIVRRVDDRFQVIAGERRLRAAVKAGWTDVPIRIMDVDDRQMAELAIIENLQRKDLNPLEKAASFQRYLDQYRCTQEELASRLKLDRSTVANVIRLLELPEQVQQALRQSKITQGHARALLPLGDEREQIAFCKRIQREGFSVRKTEAMVQEAIEAADAEPLGLVGRDGKSTRPRRMPSEHTATLEQEFRAALGTKVKITHNSRGRGKLVIHFNSHEEFERLRHQICGPGHSGDQSQVG